MSVPALLTENTSDAYSLQFGPGTFGPGGPSVRLPVAPTYPVAWARSPDGRRLALDVGSDQLFFVDLARGVVTGWLDGWHAFVCPNCGPLGVVLSAR